MVSFVIPCYRSEKTIENVVKEIDETMTGKDYEIILVNDSSPDNTFSVIESLCKSHDNITGVNLNQNYGQHAALMAGFHYVSGDIIVCLDDDGQTPHVEHHALVAQGAEEVGTHMQSQTVDKHRQAEGLGIVERHLQTRRMPDAFKSLYV